MKPLLARLGRSELLEDKTFVEYRANPGALVNIRYQITDGKDKGGRVITEPMTMVYEGIFVKEFTLFYGDRLTWFVTEEDEEGDVSIFEDEGDDEDDFV